MVIFKIIFKFLATSCYTVASMTAVWGLGCELNQPNERCSLLSPANQQLIQKRKKYKSKKCVFHCSYTLGAVIWVNWILTRVNTWLIPNRSEPRNNIHNVYSACPWLLWHKLKLVRLPLSRSLTHGKRLPVKAFLTLGGKKEKEIEKKNRVKIRSQMG